ncbi:hypothetical protein ARMGADRAFT_1041115 [Armillaria gallica]|uniref:Uncharacterized protein n=1 Tax=Armillaria gallica TaxID=47427 RepID=A0A2H3CCE2_ARMGA|nr:hypothetical protein ARMGADRAFT_1041115 [Armillaria gallica]
MTRRTYTEFRNAGLSGDLRLTRLARGIISGSDTYRVMVTGLPPYHGMDRGLLLDDARIALALRVSSTLHTTCGCQIPDGWVAELPAEIKYFVYPESSMSLLLETMITFNVPLSINLWLTSKTAPSVRKVSPKE